MRGYDCEMGCAGGSPVECMPAGGLNPGGPSCMACAGKAVKLLPFMPSAIERRKRNEYLMLRVGRSSSIYGK